jgi:hypothetical protein
MKAEFRRMFSKLFGLRQLKGENLRELRNVVVLGAGTIG